MKPPVSFQGMSSNLTPPHSASILSSWRSMACSRLAASLVSARTSRWRRMPALSSLESWRSSPGTMAVPTALDSASQCRSRMPGLQTAEITGRYVLNSSSLSRVPSAKRRCSARGMLFVSRCSRLYHSLTRSSTSSGFKPCRLPSSQSSLLSENSDTTCHKEAYGSSSFVSSLICGQSLRSHPNSPSSSLMEMDRSCSSAKRSCSCRPVCAFSARSVASTCCLYESTPSATSANSCFRLERVCLSASWNL
mmetsp:Transcript_27594/g.74626  ORF Transcript_27594/g.74626 Transcript_27594/m.74626 type:complete len:250 (+) Transcript_27594:9794-10543(+)